MIITDRTIPRINKPIEVSKNTSRKFEIKLNAIIVEIKKKIFFGNRKYLLRMIPGKNKT